MNDIELMKQFLSVAQSIQTKTFLHQNVNVSCTNIGYNRIITVTISQQDKEDDAMVMQIYTLQSEDEKQKAFQKLIEYYFTLRKKHNE